MKATDSEPVLSLDEVTKVYPGPVPVRALDRCSLTVAKDDYVAVRGPSGSGKSTLLNIMGLLDTPTEGTYRVAGRSVGELSDGELTELRAESIGFVFQAFHLLEHRSALENVEFGMLYRGVDRAERRRRAVATLDSLGLADRTHSRVATMSGGERQRVAIGRAVVGEPRVLLCDEPTGNLDSENSAMVMSLLTELNRVKRVAVVVITHDASVAQQAARSVTIIDGQLEEAG